MPRTLKNPHTPNKRNKRSNSNIRNRGSNKNIRINLEDPIEPFIPFVPARLDPNDHREFNNPNEQMEINKPINPGDLMNSLNSDDSSNSNDTYNSNDSRKSNINSTDLSESSNQMHRIQSVSDLKPELVESQDITVITALSHTVEQKIALSLFEPTLESTRAPYQFLILDKRIVGAKINDPSLSHFPKALFDLSALQNLSIYRTSIEIIPSGLVRLQKLTRLTISRNKLIQFPDEVIELPNLHSLNFERNQISSLPAALRTHPSLTDINLSSNPLRSLSGYPAKCIMTCEYIHRNLTWKGWILALIPVFDSVLRYNAGFPRFMIYGGNLFDMTPADAHTFCDQIEQAHGMLNFPLPLTTSKPVLPAPGQYSMCRPPAPYQPMIPAFK
ncbi:MAG: leucine-rich repeat domain-containing protein, partial [Promethearchaeota archaeon]